MNKSNPIVSRTVLARILLVATSLTLAACENGFTSTDAGGSPTSVSNAAVHFGIDYGSQQVTLTLSPEAGAQAY